MFQLRIELEDIEPKIWRRIIVPANISLDVLHGVIQGAMAWQDTHLHEFEINGQRYTMPELDDEYLDPDDNASDERNIRLNEQVKKGDEFTYTYDFGDNWRHRILVEKYKKVEGSPDTVFPGCIAGERACPPEDCGGPYSYGDFLDALRDPKHEDHETIKTWAGAFEPELFSIPQAHAFVDAMYYMGLEKRSRWLLA